ncbi:hypothetical protein AC1031_005388 [Aphanomyces cochlioides]|nr:hypothetical protein AC1031_005388 [Aphanomyces cochlioides]
MWTRVNLKKETAPVDSRQARAYRNACNDFSDAYMNKKHTLQELLNESMSEGLLVYIADHLHPSMQSALHNPEKTREYVALSLGLSTDPTKPVSRATQHLALGLNLLLNTKSTVVQCNTTYQPGHSDKCTKFWDWIFDAILDALTTKKTYHLPDEDPIPRLGASFSAIIRHVVMNWNKGTCVLEHLSSHPNHVTFLLDYIDNDDIRDSVVRLIYCDHSHSAMQLLKNTKMISQLVQRLTKLPWSADKDNIQSVLRSLVFAPYISPRGDLLYVKSIPKDKLTGEPDYMQLCGTSRDLTCTPMRQFTSRKIRHLVHMIMEQNHVPGIVNGMLQEFLNYAPGAARVSFGCTRHLTSLFELVTTVEFTEKTGKGHIGIECQYMHCQTHVMVRDTLTVGGEDVQVVLNCMMGIQVQTSSPQVVALEIIKSVKSSGSKDVVIQINGKDDLVLTTKSKDEQKRWVDHLQNALKGNVVELDIFCSDDWKSNLAEFRGLRLAVVETMEKHTKAISSIFQTCGLASWPLLHLCDMTQAMVGMQSKRLDTMLVSCGLIDWLLDCYAVVQTSWILTRVSQIIVFYLSDPNCKRSRGCPVVARIMERGPAKFAAGPKGFVQCIYEEVDHCLHCPHSNSTIRVGQLASENPAWMKILKSMEPTTEPPHPSTVPAILQSANFPKPPSFQKDILDLLAQPSFASYDIGSSFLVGNGCVFGYVYKRDGPYWKRALVVYEQTSYKLWSFIPSQQKQYSPINWQWMVPTSVQPRFCHGEDELHTSIGHHGFDVVSDPSHNNMTWNFCTTALHERDEWIQVLQTAAATIAALTQHAKEPPSGASRECVNCHAAFHVFRRPHPCFRCGKTLCSKCSKTYQKPIPEMAIHTAVCHCQSCFEATGGAMSEQFPTLIQGGSPVTHGSGDIDRVGPELEGINKTRQGGSRRHMYHIDIPTNEKTDSPKLGKDGFPSTPLEVEDNPGFSKDTTDE